MKINNFSYSRRLHEKEEFEQVLKNRRVTDHWLCIQYRSNFHGFDRLGLIVSKRVVSKSTGRNRIKRLIREQFRINSCNLKSSYDIVITLRKNFAPEDTTTFIQKLLNLLLKIRE